LAPVTSQSERNRLMWREIELGMWMMFFNVLFAVTWLWLVDPYTTVHNAALNACRGCAYVLLLMHTLGMLPSHLTLRLSTMATSPTARTPSSTSSPTS